MDGHRQPAYKHTFSDMWKCPTALGYWNIDLVTRYADALPCDVNLETYITRRVKSKLPMMSAAMDDIGGSPMMIGLALDGVVGTADKTGTPAGQAAVVKRTKRFQQGCINDPMVLGPNSPVDEAVSIWNVHRYKAIPVTEDAQVHGKLVGMLREDAYVLGQHSGEKVSEWMKQPSELEIRPYGITPAEAANIILETGRSELLVVDNNHSLWGMYKLADIRMSHEYQNASKDSKGRLLVAAAVGGPGSDLTERLKHLAEAEVDILVIDTSQGCSKGVGELTLPIIKRDYPDIDVIAGNVDNGKSARYLMERGADAVKVGIGPSPICRTKRNIGGGEQQAAAVSESKQEAIRYKEECGVDVPIIADGGITEIAGDFIKAYACGASAVMIGSLLAGVDEAPGEKVQLPGHEGFFKRYRGMGSIDAQNAGSSSRYCQDGKTPKKPVSHGVVAYMPCKGPVQDQILKISNTLKDAMSKYYNCRTIADLNKGDLEFTIVNRNPPEEPHNLVIMKGE